jgi:mRNA-degrading endonuclease RelE of RelBE toxin-antitoxin system
MDYYEIDFRESANKDLRKIPKQFLKNIIHKISTLKENPFPYGYVKLSGSKI